MRFFKFLGAVTVTGALLTSCTSVAHVEKDDTVNFSNYKTYAWTADSEQGARETNLADRKTRAAIDAELAKQGWRAVKNNPDVLVSYDMLVERNKKQSNSPV